MKIASLAFLLAAAGCYYDPATTDGPSPGAGDSASSGQGDGPSSQTDGSVAAKRRELKGGSRLKAKIVTGEDGSEAAIGLFDTKLGVDCAFAQAEDGKMRCLPTDLARSQIMTGALLGYSGIDTGGLAIYLDSACARRAALAPLCNPSVKYMRYVEACGGPVRIAEVVEVANASVYTFNGSCSANPTSQPSNTRLYGMGRVMAATEFVLGSMALE